MFQVGELIIYGHTGVCRVEGIGPLDNVRGADKDRQYYRLSVVNGGGNIFAPVDTAAFMRPILTAEEVNALIDTLPEIEPEDCGTHNPRMLTDRYHAAFDTHKCEDLLQLMKTIHAKGQETMKRGKRLGMVDQGYKKRAEDIIYGEFAAALGIPFEEVEAYIEKRLTEVQTTQ